MLIKVIIMGLCLAFENGANLISFILTGIFLGAITANIMSDSFI